ncbi:MAG TPA: hypothetical protein DG753_10650 [Clostridium sp.]|nr:hypothetical protein [Clostridium sp.]
MDGNSIMKTGWINDNSTCYYTDNSGAMKNGWLNYNGNWYYLKSYGTMATGWLVYGIFYIRKCYTKSILSI